MDAGEGAAGRGDASLQLQLLPPTPDAALDPVLRALQQQRERQLRRLLQLQRQASLDAERRVAAEVKQLREVQRRQSLEVQRREQRAVRSSHASLVESRRLENMAAREQQEAAAQQLLQARLQLAGDRAAAAAQQRQAELRQTQIAKAASKAAAVAAIRQRAEQAEEERRRHYLAKSALVDEKFKQTAEQRKAAEAARKEEEQRRELLRRLHLNRADLEEREKRAYFQKKQEAKDRELASRRQELQELRKMKVQEAQLKEAYARQRRELAQQREAERAQQVAQRMQQKQARVEALEARKAQLKQALEQVRRDIARQEEAFKEALAVMQRSGQYTGAAEVAELHALLAPSPQPSPALLAYYGSSSSSHAGSSLAASRPSSRQRRAGGSSLAEPLRHGAAAGATAPAVRGPQLAQGSLNGGGRVAAGGTAESSPRICAYRGGSGPATGEEAAQAELEGSAEYDFGKLAGGAARGAAGQLAEQPEWQAGAPASVAADGASALDEGMRRLQLQDCLRQGQGQEGSMAHHTDSQQLAHWQAAYRSAASSPGADSCGAEEQEGGSDPRAQLQALLQAEVAAEAERELLVAQVADPAERRQLMKAFMAEREQAKQAILALAQGLGMG